ncbi:MAG: DUF58 domain-containing protein [Caldilineales bacterium]|nr:DUF58 domain-containing protein [Caldilineales bacterium]
MTQDTDRQTDAQTLMVGAQASAGTEARLRNLPRYFGVGKRKIDIEVEEQFSSAWFGMALLLTILGLILQLQPILTIAAFLLLIAGVSWVWNRLSFFGLEYNRRFSVKRTFVGETVELTLAVANHKILPVSWLRIADTFPTELPFHGGTIVQRHDTNQGELSTFWALKWRQRASRSYQIEATQRGFYRYGPARLETGDLFGLFHAVRRLEQEQTLIVYPRVVPLAALGLPAKEPFGDMSTPLFLFDDPLRTVGVRDYHPEDDFRRLHWKASARRQQLQTRVLEPSLTRNLVVVLNVATLAQTWQGVLPDALEQAVSVAASICYHGIAQRWPTGLLANGALPRSDQPIRLPPGRSPAQLTTILEMLAAVTPFATAPVERLIAAESPRLPWGSTLVIVTAIVTEALAATLLDLQRVGRRIALVSLDPQPLSPALKHILTYQLARGPMNTLDLGRPQAGGDVLLDPVERQRQAIREARGPVV